MNEKAFSYGPLILKIYSRPKKKANDSAIQIITSSLEFHYNLIIVWDLVVINSLMNNLVVIFP